MPFLHYIQTESEDNNAILTVLRVNLTCNITGRIQSNMGVSFIYATSRNVGNMSALINCLIMSSRKDWRYERTGKLLDYVTSTLIVLPSYFGGRWGEALVYLCPPPPSS